MCHSHYQSQGHFRPITIIFIFSGETTSSATFSLIFHLQPITLNDCIYKNNTRSYTSTPPPTSSIRSESEVHTVWSTSETTSSIKPRVVDRDLKYIGNSIRSRKRRRMEDHAGSSLVAGIGLRQPVGVVFW